MQMHGWGRSPRLQDRCQRGQRVNPRMAPFGRAMSSCRWAALMVHRGAWCAFTATATKSKSRLFLQNNSFLVNKQTFLEKLHSLQLSHPSQCLDTCSNPLKTCHGIKSLPPNTCYNLHEQHYMMPEVSRTRESHPSWHGFASSINLAGGIRGCSSPPWTPLVSTKGNSVSWQKPAHLTSTEFTQKNTKERSYHMYLELTSNAFCLARLFQQTCKRDVG